MPRPKKKPTKKDLEEIQALASMGLTQQQIADIKEICVDTLRKYSLEAFNKGKSKGIAKVAQTAFAMAVSGKSPAMTIFYLKTQAGWVEPVHVPEELKHLFKNFEED